LYFKHKRRFAYAYAYVVVLFRRLLVPLRFKVVRTNGHDEVMARAANLIVGRAAYETARLLYPNDRVDYRDGWGEDHCPQ
jgi:hypothetical protein